MSSQPQPLDIMVDTTSEGPGLAPELVRSVETC